MRGSVGLLDDEEDAVTRALLVAFDEFVARYKPTQARILKGHEHGGEFGSRVTDLLEKWVRGDIDQTEVVAQLNEFDRPAIKLAAERYGVNVPPRMALTAMKSALLAAARDRAGLPAVEAAAPTPRGRQPKLRTPDLVNGDRIVVELTSENELVPEMVFGDRSAFPVTVLGHNPDGSLHVRTDDGRELDTVPDALHGTFYRLETAAEAKRRTAKPARVPRPSPQAKTHWVYDPAADSVSRVPTDQPLPEGAETFRTKKAAQQYVALKTMSEMMLAGHLATDENGKVHVTPAGREAYEPLRGPGAGALGEVPAGRVRGNRGQGRVLHRPGRPDQRVDSGADTEHGGHGAAGGELPAEGGAAELRPAASGGAGAAGAAAASGGRRPGTGRVEPVFRPAGQEDLAPTGEMARLRANVDALRTLRRLQADGNRPATADEQRVLARWSGWGSIPNVFDTNPRDPEAWRRKYGAAVDELHQLLSKDEFAAAARTTLNAHYTDATYVDAIWDALGKLGFEGGRVLEPGSGSGNFMGRAPADTHMVGVELDPITAAISQKLYPNATILPESFADTRLPDASFDATVGNVPFANVELIDRRHNAGKHSIHNHFIIKSLHLTRPGGLVAVLTSRYTMDSRNPAARREIADLGDLVGAVRLPGGAHRRAAGTEVVTDLLIFRRREPGAPPAGLPFEQTKPVDVDGTDVNVNEVFADHPDLVLGKYALGGMRHADDLDVVGNPDAGPALRDALAKVVSRAKADGLVMTRGDGTSTAGELPFVPLSTQQPDGYIRALPDGKFVQVQRGVEKPYEPPKTQTAELRDLLHLRDVEVALLDEESTNADDTPRMEALRAELNTAYDAYLAKYGPINRFTTRRTGRKDEDTGEDILSRVPPPQGGFRDDPYAAAVRALETYNAASGTTTKADIFAGRVAAPRARKLGADNAEDALAISLDENGRVWLDDIARLLGVDNNTARHMLGEHVYDDPETHELVPAPAYLSGNVREKLALARAAAAEDPAYQVNVDALQRVLPPDLSASDIHAQLGAPWIEPAIVQQFLSDILRDRSVKVTRPYGTVWTVEPGDRYTKNSIAATSEWGTPDRTAYDIAENLLTQRPIRVTDTYRTSDGGTRSILNPAKTEAANDKARQMADRFAEWAWEDPARAERLTNAYNTVFNSLVLRTYGDTDPVLPGMSTRFVPHPHVKAAVSRIIAEPAVGLWHEVGAGKTAEMTIGAMELRRLGLARKPAIVVPNHMLEQFRNEFLQVYPQAKILAAGSEDLANTKTRDGRREFIARAATGDWDAIIITKDAFKSIPLSPEEQEAYLRTEIADLDEALNKANTALREAKQSYRGDAKGAEKTVKQIQAAKQKAEQRIKANIAKAKKDPGVTFENTGIDYLMIDEAHNYKNLRRVSAIEGMSIPGSGIATDLDAKIGYLRKRNPHHVVTLATATPIANSMGETHTMLRYLRPDLLDQLKIKDFDSFAGQFGTVVTGVEPAPEGGWRVKSRFAKFVNVPELLRPWGIAGDIKTAEDLEHITKPPKLAARPSDGKRLPEPVIVPASEELKAVMEQLGARAKAIRNRGGRAQKGEDNMLNITNDGRAAALDLRLVGRSTTEPTKLDVAADNIAAIYRENKDRVYPVLGKPGVPSPTTGALQFVFADQGTPGGKGFNVYEALRTKLEERGVPRDKVKFIHEAATAKDKAQLFAAANDGRVAVLIGSTEKMGTGTNAQWRAVALHHLDVPWRPADVQQREGRIIRQKNQNPEVRVLRYVTEKSFDEYNWKTVARKATYISQLMRGKLDNREIEDVGDGALTANEAAALAAGDELLIDHANAQAEVTRLERLQRAYENNQKTLRYRIKENQAAITRSQHAIAAADDAIGKRVDTRGDAFRMVVDNAGYDKRTEALTALRGQLQDIPTYSRYPREVGSVGGFTIQAHRETDGLHLELVGVPGSEMVLSPADLAGADLVAKLENKLYGLESLRANNVANIDQAQDVIGQAEKQLTQRFQQSQALGIAKAHFVELDEAIRERAEAKPGAAPTPLIAELLQDDRDNTDRELEALIVRSLVDAIEAIRGGEIVRRDVSGELRIGKGYEGAGQWRGATARLVALLQDWAAGEGPSMPGTPEEQLSRLLTEEKFTRDQLRTAVMALRDKALKAGDNARAMRLTPTRGAEWPQLINILHTDLKTALEQARYAEKPQANFSIKGHNGTRREVAVWRQGTKPALYENRNGKRGSLIEKFDSLADLEQWAVDRKETGLAEWARRERGLASPVPAPRRASRGNPVSSADVRARLAAARPDDRPTLLDSLNLNATQARTLARDLGVKGASRLDVAGVKRKIVDYFDVPMPRTRTRASGVQANRQAKLDHVRHMAESLAEIDELADVDASPRAMEHTIRTRAKLNGLDEHTTGQLVDAASDRRTLQTALGQIAEDHGLKLSTGRAGAIEPYNPARHELLGGAPDKGTPVRIIRPGYEATVDGKKVKVQKAVAQIATADEAKALAKPTKLNMSQTGVLATLKFGGGSLPVHRFGDGIRNKTAIDSLVALGMVHRDGDTLTITEDGRTAVSLTAAGRTARRLNYSESDILSLLEMSGGSVKASFLAPRPIAAWGKHTPSRMDVAIDTLEKLGLLHRDAEKVTMTEAGRTALAEARERHKTAFDADAVAEHIAAVKTPDEAMSALAELNKTQLAKVASKFPGTPAMRPSVLMTSDRKTVMHLPDGMTLDEMKQWLANTVTDKRFHWRSAPPPASQADIARRIAAFTITRGHPHPGQHYKHGWIPVAGEALKAAVDVAKGTAVANDRKPMSDAQFTARQKTVAAAVSGAYDKLNTYALYRDAHGVWDPERDAQQRQIAAEMYARHADVPADGRAIFTGGLGGAGKTTVLTKHLGVKPSEYVVLNPDDAKEELAARGMVPEIPGHPDLSPMERSALIHSESGRIADLVADMAYQDGKNVIWDVTMRDPTWLNERVADLRRMGYDDVRGVFVDIPPATSVDRAMGRYRSAQDDFLAGKGHGGRYVPPDLILANALPNGSTRNRQVFDENRHLFDVWSLFDNSGTSPTLVDEGGRT